MIAADEDALVCDLAETYHILNYKALPLRLAATLAAGLPLYSRSKSDPNNPSDLRLLIGACAADTLRRIEYMLAGAPEGQAPASLTAALLGEPEVPDTDLQAFDSPEELMQALYGDRNGGDSDGD